VVTILNNRSSEVRLKGHKKADYFKEECNRSTGTLVAADNEQKIVHGIPPEGLAPNM